MERLGADRARHDPGQEAPRHLPLLPQVGRARARGLRLADQLRPDGARRTDLDPRLLRHRARRSERPFLHAGDAGGHQVVHRGHPRDGPVPRAGTLRRPRGDRAVRRGARSVHEELRRLPLLLLRQRRPALARDVGVLGPRPPRVQGRDLWPARRPHPVDLPGARRRGRPHARRHRRSGAGGGDVGPRLLVVAPQLQPQHLAGRERVPRAARSDARGGPRLLPQRGLVEEPRLRHGDQRSLPQPARTREERYGRAARPPRADGRDRRQAACHRRSRHRSAVADQGLRARGRLPRHRLDRDRPRPADGLRQGDAGLGQGRARRHREGGRARQPRRLDRRPHHGPRVGTGRAAGQPASS